MESVSSNSPSPPDRHRHHHYRHQLRFNPTQPISDRILRALCHRLGLLHHSQSNFFVLGATGNVYTVTLSSTPSCTCPDRTTPCKHILFIYIKVLGVSLDDTCLRRRNLRPCQLSRLLDAPILHQSLAGENVRKMFHEMFFKEKKSRESIVEIEDGTRCPVCQEEMGKEERVVVCATCRNGIHEECLDGWKRSRGRRWVSCVICRARWRRRGDEGKYLNLGAYVGEDDMGESSNNSGLCGGLGFAM